MGWATVNEAVNLFRKKELSGTVLGLGLFGTARWGSSVQDLRTRTLWVQTR